jgi:hypothetical protein
MARISPDAATAAAVSRRLEWLEDGPNVGSGLTAPPLAARSTCFVGSLSKGV